MTKAQQAREMLTPPLFKTICMDPPWPERGGGKSKRGADRHYPTVQKSECPAKITEIVLQSGVWRPDPEGSHLYIWYTNNYLPDALQLMASLGYRYVTQRTWAKTRIGLGQYWRGQTEHVLFGVRGRLPAQVKTESTLIGKGLIPRQSKHSEKPADFYREVEKVSPGPYLEMFARKPRDGWTVWGNEVETIDTTSTVQEALDAARPHVYRQQFAGKHEQDREDAKAWVEKYGGAKK